MIPDSKTEAYIDKIRIENLHVNSHSYRHLIFFFTKIPRIHIGGEKVVSSTIGDWEKMSIHLYMNEARPTPLTLHNY